MSTQLRVSGGSNEPITYSLDVTPKFNLGDTVFVRNGDSVTKAKVIRWKAVLCADTLAPFKQCHLTYCVSRDLAGSAGDDAYDAWWVDEHNVFASAEEAFATACAEVE